MDPKIKELIEDRARSLYPMLHRTLIENSDYMLEECFRYVFLVLKRPKAFFDAFKNGSLSIDEALVEQAFWSFRFDMPGISSLMSEERELIRTHNLEVAKINSTQSPGLRTSLTGLTPAHYRYG